MTRSAPTFANINLLGKCTLDCAFCLGKDLKAEFSKYDFNKVHFDAWSRFEEFLTKCKQDNIEQLYITGQNTDPTCYKYIHELVDYLQSEEFYVGVRSNGMISDIALFNSCNTKYGDAVGLTILSRNPETFYMMTNRHREMPNWDVIIPQIAVPLRIAIVVTTENVAEVSSLLKYISHFENVNYVQLRRVSTVTREQRWARDQVAFERLAKTFERLYPKVGEYETAPIYKVHGLDVSLWRTVKTTANSYNYFVNGVISTEYEIIRGYMNEKGITHGESEDGKQAAPEQRSEHRLQREGDADRTQDDDHEAGGEGRDQPGTGLEAGERPAGIPVVDGDEDREGVQGEALGAVHDAGRAGAGPRWTGVLLEDALERIQTNLNVARNALGSSGIDQESSVSVRMTDVSVVLEYFRHMEVL